MLRPDTSQFNDVITVVLVEDHVALRKGIELLLGRRGHVVAGAAADARSGYQVIRSKRPDVALVDLDLPDDSGTKLCQLLADDPEQKILIYTAPRTCTGSPEQSTAECEASSTRPARPRS